MFETLIVIIAKVLLAIAIIDGLILLFLWRLETISRRVKSRADEEEKRRLDEIWEESTFRMKQELRRNKEQQAAQSAKDDNIMRTVERYYGGGW